MLLDSKAVEKLAALKQKDQSLFRRIINHINVPVYINEHANCNRVMMDVNKVATVFGKKYLRGYIQREIKKGNIVRIKNRSIQTSEPTAPIAASYGMNTSNNNISQNNQNSQEKIILSKTAKRIFCSCPAQMNCTPRKIDSNDLG